MSFSIRQVYSSWTRVIVLNSAFYSVCFQPVIIGKGFHICSCMQRSRQQAADMENFAHVGWLKHCNLSLPRASPRWLQCLTNFRFCDVSYDLGFCLQAPQTGCSVSWCVSVTNWSCTVVCYMKFTPKTDVVWKVAIETVHHHGWPLTDRQTICLLVTESDAKYMCEQVWTVSAHAELHTD